MFYGILIDMTVTLIENVTYAITFFAGLSKTLNVFYLIRYSFESLGFKVKD